MVFNAENLCNANGGAVPKYSLIKNEFKQRYSLDTAIPRLLSGLKDYFKFYNFERPHQALVGNTPAEIYRGSEVASKAT